MNFIEFEKLLRGAFAPRILLVTTDGVESACLKNSVKLVDLLRAYSDFPKESRVIRGIREEPYELKGFRCQLVEMEHFQLTETLEDAVEKELNTLVRRVVPEDNSARYRKNFRVASMEDAVSFPRNQPLSSFLPWYEEYQRHFLSSFGVSEHEFFSHPVACE